MYDILKNEIDGNRLRVHSNCTMEGKLFIKFITMIIYMSIFNIMEENKLFEKYSLKEVLLELKKIKIIHIDNYEPIISEISKKTKKFTQNF